MTPIDWLVLLLAAAPGPLDPVRLQKGLFLLAAEIPLAAGEAYAFVPYSYGPMSRQIYADSRRLCGLGLARAEPADGHRWEVLSLAPTGLERAPLLLARARRAHPAADEHLARVRALVDQLPFAALLDYVYERHPAYASRSVFRRP